nr:hypothetical protein Iba_chr10dCG0500 [Ipomoea batatas]
MRKARNFSKPPMTLPHRLHRSPPTTCFQDDNFKQIVQPSRSLPRHRSSLLAGRLQRSFQPFKTQQIHEATPSDFPAFSPLIPSSCARPAVERRFSAQRCFWLWVEMAGVVSVVASYTDQAVSIISNIHHIARGTATHHIPPSSNRGWSISVKPYPAVLHFQPPDSTVRIMIDREQDSQPESQAPLATFIRSFEVPGLSSAARWNGTLRPSPNDALHGSSISSSQIAGSLQRGSNWCVEVTRVRSQVLGNHLTAVPRPKLHAWIFQSI